MTTNPNLAQAREWANLHLNISNHRLNAPATAAAEVILSLPDQWIDAEKVQELLHWREVIEQTPIKPTEAHLIALLHALLAPQPRTLADMDDDERSACQWMQVQVHGVPSELGTIIYLTEHHATVLWHDGTTTLRNHKELTPLPDLPRMEWPDQHHATTRHPTDRQG